MYVVVLNWNARAVTAECLESLAAVDYPRRTILLVDNGSTDGSVGALRAAYREIEILALPANRGFAGGMNAGMRHALDHGAEMVLLLNNDTLVNRQFLRALVDAMQNRPAAGMAAPKIYYAAEPDRIWVAGGAISFWLGTMRHVGIREYDHGQYNVQREIPHATGCCLLVRREVIERVGLLDESYYLYGEDADWVLRTREAGYTILYEPRAAIWHKISVSSGGHLSWAKNTNKLLGTYRFFFRHASWYHWLVFPWMTILANGAAAIRYLVTNRRPL